MMTIGRETGRTFRLCIDSYEYGIPEGRLFHPGLENGAFRFRSLTQLLLKIEELLDGMRPLQPLTAMRSFAPIYVLSPEEAALESSGIGALGTFLLRPIFRQHATWQGTVTWLEGGGEQNFRSVLELIVLMNSVLSELAVRSKRRNRISS